MSGVSNQGELYAGITIMRLLGQGALGLISTTLIAIWFIRLRGRVTAIGALGAVISQAAFPPLIFLLISTVGWRSSWVILAFVIWATIVLPAALLVRRSPESVGLLPDGAADTNSGRKEQDTPEDSGEVSFSLAEAMKTRSFWLLLFAGTSQSLISTALVFNNDSLITSKGLDAGVAASIFTVMAPMALVGNFAAGFLLDRYNNRSVLAVAQVLLIVPMLWSLLISSAWQALIYGGMLDSLVKSLCRPN